MKVAVVTGGSSGIGQSAALQLARRGTGVILTYSSNARGAEDTVSRIEQLGGTAVALPLDIGDTTAFPAFRDAVAGALRETFQRDSFDHLVNNAGFAGEALIADTTEQQFDRLADGLFKGPFFLTRTLLPLLADGGAIVNLTSNSALRHVTAPGYSVYAACKGAMAVMTRYMAKEFSSRGIRVNSVAPGATRTRFADDAFDKYPEIIPELAKTFALGRVGEPDDVGAVIAVLVSDEGRWITGQDIEVSGGQNL
ncbi:SDR family NAD(P)-dependent oxidoreductase [Streptomyces thermodiastaticus]|jgi:NAD(P)-dependent dehydrogenase (short-subunit alcohol dehydrogenase family)|uniref:SDR family NAD(P)-dependent oxidoreductase n=1 Tax=Streptomyces thermodiastaticus TaxID=44061 RepID=UPI001679C302|nr:SDR family oxidoreductase [Streptomyces thermodiastaticus]MCE7548939.1 SDR family oxidoreductase [Streptomyces thermodiastaticus]GHF75466.1 short-chain dehydrogenase [Streptomyces thermodiastaticus]